MIYGGIDDSDECRYELILCTNVDLPAPAMPIVIMHIAFFFSVVVDIDVEGAELVVVFEDDMLYNYSRRLLVTGFWVMCSSGYFAGR